MNHPKTKVAKGKILIADDNRINQQLLTYQLNELNSELIFASNGSEAIQLFANSKDIRLVLMDIRMPGMDGIEATRKILELDPSAKVIALSAFSREDNSFEASAVGFVDYITKPIQKEILLKVISKYLQQYVTKN